MRAIEPWFFRRMGFTAGTAAGLFRWVFLGVVLLLAGPAALLQGGENAQEAQWFKGATHSHSLWSDGDEFPDMVVDWFKSRGYQFFCLTDHNVLMEGDRWVRLARQRRPIPESVFEAYRARFGDDWVEMRGEGAKREVRLKTFEEIRSRMDEPGKFLLIQGEEISDRTSGRPPRHVHLNGLNLAKLIRPHGGATAVQCIRDNVLAVGQQAKEVGRPMVVHVNHPNWGGYSVSARDLAEVPEARFVEMCNCYSSVCHWGDKDHPGVERLWDIANTLRLIEKKAPPLYGVASDDAHNYHDAPASRPLPGRGWIGVRAARLEADALMEAMIRGDFYASTGVELAAVEYDPAKRTLHVEVAPKPNANYTIEFVGTPADVQWTDDKALDTLPDVGKVLASHSGTSATYRFSGEELYVRAVIRSDRQMERPIPNGVQTETAWTQPVGWETRVSGK